MKTTFKVTKLIFGKWATFEVIKGKSKVDITLPDGKQLSVDYAPVLDESQLTRFAYGFGYGFEACANLKDEAAAATTASDEYQKMLMSCQRTIER